MDSEKQHTSTQAKGEEKTRVDAGDLSTPPSTDQAEAGPQQQHGPEVVYPKRIARILILSSLCLSVCKQPPWSATTLCLHRRPAGHRAVAGP